MTSNSRGFHSLRVWVAWFVVHLILIVLTVGRHIAVTDVRYYYRGLNPFSEVAIAGRAASGASLPEIPLGEYPHAALWPLRLLNLIGGSDEELFIGVFAAFCTLISAVMLWIVGRLSPAGDRGPAWVWVAFCAAVGPILLTRLDIIPGVLVAATIAAAVAWPVLAGALLAMATMTKLWPGILASALVGQWTQRSTWLRVGSFIATLILLAGITLLTAGPERLLSPLSYQGDRGLQIEAIAATPFIVASAVDPHRWPIDFATSLSFEVSGPGVSVAMVATTLLMAATVLAAAGSALRSLRRQWSVATACAAILLGICLLIVANKVFSPQYLVWFGPSVAVGCALIPGRRMRRIAGLTVIAAALTMVVYPATYAKLIDPAGPQALAVIVLVLRNLLILVITGQCLALFREQWRAGSTRRTSARSTGSTRSSSAP